MWLRVDWQKGTNVSQEAGALPTIFLYVILVEVSCLLSDFIPVTATDDVLSYDTNYCT